MPKFDMSEVKTRSDAERVLWEISGFLYTAVTAQGDAANLPRDVFETNNGFEPEMVYCSVVDIMKESANAIVHILDEGILEKGE